ncbi:ChbG/HpnK family deacetylase [bacterium]|nr:ChbG/HpnK family deacetylase [bacterium]
MIQLIVNGDDWGLCPQVNLGVIRAHREGILTSTSLLANGAAWEQACQLSRTCPRLSVGLHLNLTWGAPVLPAAEVASLVDPHGCFYSKWIFIRRAFFGAVNVNEMAAEAHAQLQRVQSAGVTLSHLDSHHHIHCLPTVGRLMAELSAQYGLPVLRRFYGAEAGSSLHAKTAAWICRAGIRRSSLAGRTYPVCRFYGYDLMVQHDKKAALASILHGLPDGLNEVMCHPAQANVSQPSARIRLDRFLELQALCDKNIRKLLDERGIMLISTADGKEIHESIA